MLACLGGQIPSTGRMPSGRHSPGAEEEFYSLKEKRLNRQKYNIRTFYITLHQSCLNPLVGIKMDLLAFIFSAHLPIGRRLP